MKKGLKKTVTTLALAGILALSGLAGAGMGAFAKPGDNPNVDDSPIVFDNTGATRYTSWRLKYNTSQVYVYPKSGPKLYYTVQGTIKGQPCIDQESDIVVVPTGVKASIINYVHEDGNTYARLLIQRTAYSTQTTRGVWSPDSTQTYKLFGWYR